MKEVNVDRLKISLELYRDWVAIEKKYFNRRRSLPSDYIDEKLRSLIEFRELNSLFKNEKLSVFLTKVINERYLFNYSTLELEKPS